MPNGVVAASSSVPAFAPPNGQLLHEPLIEFSFTWGGSLFSSHRRNKSNRESPFSLWFAAFPLLIAKCRYTFVLFSNKVTQAFPAEQLANCQPWQQHFFFPSPWIHLHYANQLLIWIFSRSMNTLPINLTSK